MQARKHINKYIALVSFIAASATFGLSAGPGFAQSGNNPHAWGLTASTVATAPAEQSDKNPHAWGLAASTVATAPAAHSDKNPHAWGLVSPTVAARALGSH